MIPHAEIVHCIPHRMRVRIPSRKGDVTYWHTVVDTLKQMPCITAMRANPATASLLMEYTVSDRELLDFAREKNLFRTTRKQRRAIPLQQKVASGFSAVDNSVRKFSGGELDVGSITFLGLIGFGAYQIARGNFAAPAWYTVFWYALNVFLKNQHADKPDEISTDDTEA